MPVCSVAIAISVPSLSKLDLWAAHIAAATSYRRPGMHTSTAITLWHIMS